MSAIVQFLSQIMRDKSLFNSDQESNKTLGKTKSDNNEKLWSLRKKKLSTKRVAEIAVKDKAWNEKKIDSPFYPDDAVLGIFAAIVYQEVLNEGIGEALRKLKEEITGNNDESLEALKKNIDDLYLESSWTLIEYWKSENDGYCGAAFYNEKESQLIISHRGTMTKGTRKEIIQCLLTDYEGVFKVGDTSQIHSACSFSDEVLKRFEGKKISISFTGHSLGAWLAQISAFCCEYLEERENTFKEKESGRDQKRLIHVVAFDSPGCSGIMSKISENYFPKYSLTENAADNLSALDITIYFNFPNMINSWSSHRGIGNLIQILDNEDYKEKKEIDQKDTSSHAISKFLSLMLAFPPPDSIERLSIINWPSSYDTNSPIKTGPVKPLYWRTGYNLILGLFRGLLYKYFPYSQNSELRQFYREFNKNIKADNTKNATLYREIMPNLSADSTPDKTQRSKAYDWTDFKKNEISMSVFTKNEWSFLRKWADVGKKNTNYEPDIQKFLSENDIKDLDAFLPEFAIGVKNQRHKLILQNVESGRTEEIKSAQIINRVKNLLTFFPEAGISLERILDNIKQPLYNSLSNMYIKKEFSNWTKDVNFVDNIGLKEFLESENQNIFCLLTESTIKTQVFRIRNLLLKNHKNKNPYFLNFLSLHEINSANYSSSELDKLLIIDCQEEISPDEVNQNDKIVEKEEKKSMNELKKTASNNQKARQKQILVMQRNCSILKNLKKYDKKIHKARKLVFSDFDESTQRKFLQTKAFFLKNEKISLETLLNCSDINMLSDQKQDDCLISLFLENKTVELNSEKIFKYEFINVCMINGNFSDEANNLKLLSQNKNDFEQIFGKPAEFMITGISTCDKDDFLKHFCISDMINLHFVDTEKDKEKDEFSRLCYENFKKRVYWLCISDYNNVESAKVEVKKIFDKEFYMDRHFYYEEANAVSVNPSESDSNSNIKDELDLIQILPKTIILAAEPGMGKTNLLKKLAYELEKKWLFFIDLETAGEKFNESVKDINEDVVINFLMENRLSNKFLDKDFNLSESSQSNVVKALLRLSLKNKDKSVIIFFDGFDELSDKNKIIELLLFLKNKTKACLWITTKTHEKGQLEEALKVPTLRLDRVQEVKSNEIIENILRARFFLYVLSKEDQNIATRLREKICNAVHFEKALDEMKIDENVSFKMYMRNCELLFEDMKKIKNEVDLKRLFEKVKDATKIKSELNNQINIHFKKLFSFECTDDFKDFLSFVWSLTKYENNDIQEFLQKRNVYDKKTKQNKTFPEIYNVNKEICENFVKKTLVILDIALQEMKKLSNFEKDHLYKVPQHFRMLAEEIKKNSKENECFNSLSGFFGQLVELKLSNFLKKWLEPKKSQLKEKLIIALEEKGINFLAEICSIKELKTDTPEILLDEGRLVQVGLLEQKNDGGEQKIIFCQNYFAEYFAAKKIFDLLKCSDKKKNKGLLKFLINSKGNGVRRFLDELLLKLRSEPNASLEHAQQANPLQFFGQRMSKIINIEEKFKEELVNEDKKTALHVSITEKNEEITEKLLKSLDEINENEINICQLFIDIPDKWCQTVLFIATFNDKTELASKILDFQPKKNTVKIIPDNVHEPEKILTYSKYNMCLLEIREGGVWLSCRNNSEISRQIVNKIPEATRNELPPQFIQPAFILKK